jgi:hypothetical protein
MIPPVRPRDGLRSWVQPFRQFYKVMLLYPCKRVTQEFKRNLLNSPNMRNSDGDPLRRVKGRLWGIQRMDESN